MAETALVLASPGALATLSGEDRDRLEEALRTLMSRLESPHSKRAYAAEWRHWCAWLDRTGTHPFAASPLIVQRYISDLVKQGKTKPTRARALTVIRQIYGALVVSGLIATNPAREVKNERISAEPKTPWLAAGEVTQLLARPDEHDWRASRDWLICAALVGLGLRRAEIARLRRDQLIDAPNGFTMQVLAKRNKLAWVSVPPWLSEEMRRWCTKHQITSGPLFPAEKGRQTAVCPATVANAVKRYAKKNGTDPKRTTPHALRRSFVTITGQRKAPLEDRQSAMLHESRATTERYDHASKLPAEAPGALLEDLVPERKETP